MRQSRRKTGNHLHPQWLHSPLYRIRWIGLIIPCASLAELFLHYQSSCSEGRPVLANSSEYPVRIGIGSFFFLFVSLFFFSFFPLLSFPLFLLKSSINKSAECNGHLVARLNRDVTLLFRKANLSGICEKLTGL